VRSLATLALMNTDKSDRYVERVRLGMEREQAVVGGDEAQCTESLRDAVLCVCLCVCVRRTFRSSVSGWIQRI
jgi:hypothetical protein